MDVEVVRGGGKAGFLVDGGLGLEVEAGEIEAFGGVGCVADGKGGDLLLVEGGLLQMVEFGEEEATGVLVVVSVGEVSEAL